MSESVWDLSWTREEEGIIRRALDIRDAEAARAKLARNQAEAAKDAAYAERNQVVALLARMALALGWRAGLRSHEPDPDPTWDDDWKNVVAIDLPTGQVTWHYHDSDRPLFASLPPYPASWDGHDTVEKYRRVRALAAWPHCKTCGGSGWIAAHDSIEPGIYAPSAEECPDCGGSALASGGSR